MLNRKKIIIYGIIFVMICAGFGALGFKLVYDRQHQVSFSINADSADSADSDEEMDVEVYMTQSTSWVDKDENGYMCQGMQYDGTIVNNMDYMLKDWTVYICVTGESRIDSSWNGEYVYQDGDIIFTPDAGIGMNKLLKHSDNTFGFVLYVPYVPHAGEITGFQVVGYRYPFLTDFKAFYVLITLLVIWLIVLSCHIVIHFRSRSLILRRENDEKIILDTMTILANLIDAKDRYTNGHSERVAEYAVMLAECMNLDDDQIRKIGYIGLMHDCGKMGIPDSVLKKEGKLSDEEMDIIKSHTTLGAKILENFTAVEGIKEGALYHHERYDGKGYPTGIMGEDIPLYARIICVADSFDAMNSDRCYRAHLTMEKIISELEINKGKQFDPEIADIMIKLIRDNRVKTYTK